MPVANSGQFAAWVRGGAPDARSARATYSLDVVPKTVPETPIDLGPAAQADTIEVPVADLAALAARADDAFGERHRSDSVHRVFSRIQAADGERPGHTWTLRAGPTRMLNAPTGVGKNVAAELLACWAAERGMVTTLLVPSNAGVVRTAHSIEASHARARHRRRRGAADVPGLGPGDGGGGCHAAQAAAARWASGPTSGSRTGAGCPRRRTPRRPSMPGLPAPSRAPACDGEGRRVSQRTGGRYVPVQAVVRQVPAIPARRAARRSS